MAKLSSEDKQITTTFELSFFKNKLEVRENISWIPYSINLTSASKNLEYKPGSDLPGAGDYVLSISPVNELNTFISNLELFISDESKKVYSFEPLEPSIELIFERSHIGYSFIAWIDAGNVVSPHYTWDGFGLRIFTTEENIKRFIEELKSEAGDLYAKKN